MSCIAPSLRHQYPEADFADPALQVGLVVDQQDLDLAVSILRKFRDPAAAAARLRGIAERKGLRLPAALAAAAFAAPKYTPQQLAAMPSSQFADPLGRRWPIYDQEDLDKCLRECPDPHAPPYQGQLYRLAAMHGLQLPAGFSGGASVHFDRAGAHAANFAASDSAARAWDQEAGYRAQELAAVINARTRKAAGVQVPEAPPEPAAETVPFAAGDEAALLDRTRRFAALANAAARRKPRPPASE
jgi:hypothetical protein